MLKVSWSKAAGFLVVAGTMVLGACASQDSVNRAQSTADQALQQAQVAQQQAAAANQTAQAAETAASRSMQQNLRK